MGFSEWDVIVVHKIIEPFRKDPSYDKGTKPHWLKGSCPQ